MQEKELKLYDSSDMARIACDDCRGCSACCEGMGDTIILNPYDVQELCVHLKLDFQALLTKYAELNVQEGMILPNLKMTGERQCCGFLNEEGRCMVHTFRPGLCRLFPLGRNYENGHFRYFVVEGGCPRAGKAKVKIHKWLGIPELKRHEEFLTRWHYFTKRFQNFVQNALAGGETPEQLQQLNMVMLQGLYFTEYDEKKDFYEQFEQRLHKLEQVLDTVEGQVLRR